MLLRQMILRHRWSFRDRWCFRDRWSCDTMILRDRWCFGDSWYFRDMMILKDRRSAETNLSDERVICCPYEIWQQMAFTFRNINVSFPKGNTYNENIFSIRQLQVDHHLLHGSESRQYYNINDKIFLYIFRLHLQWIAQVVWRILLACPALRMGNQRTRILSAMVRRSPYRSPRMRSWVQISPVMRDKWIRWIMEKWSVLWRSVILHDMCTQEARWVVLSCTSTCCSCPVLCLITNVFESRCIGLCKSMGYRTSVRKNTYFHFRMSGKLNEILSDR